MRKVANPALAWLTRRGVSVRGAHVLEVPGRTSGAWRAVVVNPLTFEGARYLVAPRGDTQWVRNLRVAGRGRLQVGRRVATFTANEIADDMKPELLQAYLAHWRSDVQSYFGDVTPDAARDEFVRIAPGYPVFRIETSDAAQADSTS
jgi:deazaflavin-dependent oxidoreductase (nitroreductase family)